VMKIHGKLKRLLGLMHAVLLHHHSWTSKNAAVRTPTSSHNSTVQMFHKPPLILHLALSSLIQLTSGSFYFQRLWFSFLPFRLHWFTHLRAWCWKEWLALSKELLNLSWDRNCLHDISSILFVFMWKIIFVGSQGVLEVLQIVRAGNTPWTLSEKTNLLKLVLWLLKLKPW
jgi:hypothetical protein